MLREQRLRVHDARIATFGERVEDIFLISDEHDRALAIRNNSKTLRDALLACLEGDTGNDAANIGHDSGTAAAPASTTAFERRAGTDRRAEIDESTTRPPVERVIGLLEAGEFRVAEPSGKAAGRSTNG